ncbi:MAG: DUF4185 domain-containing protein [Proteobacteria bacterium]|nr:DUF4185 domain-containing protein [Pseudomonadota bacterium]
MDTETSVSRLGAVTGDCVVPVPAGLEALGAPVSLEFAEGSLWVFGETSLTQPSATGSDTIPNSAALVRSVDDACAGHLEVLHDDNGTPAPFIALTPDEEAENAARTDSKRISLTPCGGLVWQGKGYIYYDVLLLGPGVFDSEWLGTGLCVTPGAGSACVRQGALLWSGAQSSWGSSGFIDNDGYVYLIKCFHAAAFEDLCGVTRVMPEDMADPGAYRYYNGFSGWVEDPGSFTVAFRGPGAVTLGYNAFLGQYTAISANIWDSSIEMRAASSPSGPWANPHRLFYVVKPDSWFISGGMEHPALRSADARTIAITYYTISTKGPSGLHLVSFRLRKN